MLLFSCLFVPLQPNSGSKKKRATIFYLFSLRRYSLSRWQIQPNGASVQECLMKALSTLLRRDVEVVGAGRTDAGVHASLMVAHFDSNTPLDTDFMTDKLNRLLPPDISVYRLRAVHPDAHARFDATARTYKYYVTTAKIPFDRQYRCRLFQTPDFERMNKAAQTLFEYTDFTSFSKLHTDVKTNNCKIMYAAWTQVDDVTWVFTIQADRFLRNMVRAWWVHCSKSAGANSLLRASAGLSNRKTVAVQEHPFPAMHCSW